MIKTFVQGFTFRQKAPDGEAMLVLRSDDKKIVISAEDGYFICPADETANWQAGVYAYQILTPERLVEEGEIEIQPNFAIAEEGVSVKSRTQQIIDAIEAVIEGRATATQKSVTVGDKSISYMDLDELLKYLNYFKEKAAHEAGKTSVNDERRVKYTWNVIR